LGFGTVDYRGCVFGVAFVRRQGKLPRVLHGPSAFPHPFQRFACALRCGDLRCLRRLSVSPSVPPAHARALDARSGPWTLPWALGFVVRSNVTPMIARKICTGDHHVDWSPACGCGLRRAYPSRRRFRLWRNHRRIGRVLPRTLPMFTLTNDLIVGLAPPERAGAAAGISETAAELGGSLEIAYSAASVSLSIVAD
jgi:MFS transporter, DHA2 family, multidrug resistance protein